MDTARLRCRTAAPADWLAAQLHPALDARRRLVETCRAELAWARADWLEATATAEGWPEACLPHEQAAAHLLEIWGRLHPLEHRLLQGLERLDARRRAGWRWQATLTDVQRYRLERRGLRHAFLAATEDYRSKSWSHRDGQRMAAPERAHHLEPVTRRRYPDGDPGQREGQLDSGATPGDAARR
jgi:hypothetical protein